MSTYDFPSIKKLFLKETDSWGHGLWVRTSINFWVYDSISSPLSHAMFEISAKIFNRHTFFHFLFFKSPS